MTQFSILQTKVLRRVIDAPGAVSTEVPSLINNAIKAIERTHNFRVMETFTAATTAPSTRVLLARPTNWKEPNGRPWYEGNTGSKTRMNWIQTRSAVQGLWGTADTSAPKYLLQSEPNDLGVMNIELWPFSDSNSDWTGGEYRVKIPYFRYLPDLNADADTNWFTENAEEYIIHMATGMAFSLDWDDQRLAIFTQLGTGFRSDIIKQDKRERVAGINSFIPYWQGVNAPPLGD